MDSPNDPLPGGQEYERSSQSLTKWISITSRITQMYLNKQLEPYGLNASQHMFVMEACRRPGITQDKLPERVHINKSNVTRALVQLEQAGFIVRRANTKDKRTTRVYPTDKARTVYPALVEIIGTWNSILAGNLSLEEKSLFHDLITRVAHTALGFVTNDDKNR